MLEDIREAIRRRRLNAGPSGRDKQVTRRITFAQIRSAIGYDAPEIIEDYPDDVRGPACLVKGEIHGDVLHAVIGYSQMLDSQRKKPRPFLISVYWPDSAQWIAPAFRRRRRKRK